MHSGGHSLINSIDNDRPSASACSRYAPHLMSCHGMGGNYLPDYIAGIIISMDLLGTQGSHSADHSNLDMVHAQPLL